MHGPLPLLPAFHQARLVRDGQTTATELVEAHLARIERIDPALRSICTLGADAALAAAAAADAQAGPRGPLHGVPITIKDAFDVDGLPTACGTTAFDGRTDTFEAPSVTRLRAAGAIVLGKTNVPPFLGDIQTTNDRFGTTVNPYDPTRSAGGSSGGSAAAVAAGLSALDLGSDLAGSIRVPAAWCGIWGLKPTIGLVPKHGHVPGPPGGLGEIDISVAGPLARHPADLALTLRITAGPADPDSPMRAELRPPRALRLADYRLAVLLDDPFCPVDDEVLGPLTELCDQLASLGVQLDLKPRLPVSLEQSQTLFEQLYASEIGVGLAEDAWALSAAEAATTPRGDDEARPLRITRAHALSHRRWFQLDVQRLRMRAAWSQFFTGYDAVLTPVIARAAIEHDHTPDHQDRRMVVNGQPRHYWDQAAWVGYASLPGLPAVSAPVRWTADGLPVGLQVIGPFGDDLTAIDVAAKVCDAVGGGYRPPPLD